MAPIYISGKDLYGWKQFFILFFLNVHIDIKHNENINMVYVI